MDTSAKPSVELQARRVGLCWCAVLLAVAAAALSVAYLQPARNSTWLNLSIACAVILAPLIARPPWTRLRLLICALVWTSLGLPGGYVFGVAVFLAGLVLGVATVGDMLLRAVAKGRASDSTAPDGTPNLVR